MRPRQQTNYRCTERCSFLPFLGFISPGLEVHLLPFHLFFRARGGTRTEQIVAQEIGEPEEWTVRVRRRGRIREGSHPDKLQKVVVALGTESPRFALHFVYANLRVLLGVGQDETGAIPENEVQALLLTGLLIGKSQRQCLLTRLRQCYRFREFSS